MSGIDGRIVLIGLPTVAAYLHADAEQAIWFTALMPSLLRGRRVPVIEGPPGDSGSNIGL
jgi:hypothetical protein